MDKNKVQICSLFYSPPLKPKNYIMSIKRRFEDNSDVELPVRLNLHIDISMYRFIDI